MSRKNKQLATKQESGVVSLNPKQEAFLEAYYNPASSTFANAYQSAIKVGYSESYAKLLKAPSIGNNWISIENYHGRAQMTPDHIVAGIERIVLKSGSMDKDKLAALKLLAQLQGMIVDKQIVGHVNIEQALADLK